MWPNIHVTEFLEGEDKVSVLLMVMIKKAFHFWQGCRLVHRLTH